MSKVCCHSSKTGKGCSHCVSTNVEFKGHRILFTFSIHNVTYGARFVLHHLQRPCAEGMKVVSNRRPQNNTAQGQ